MGRLMSTMQGLGVVGAADADNVGTTALVSARLTGKAIGDSYAGFFRTTGTATVRPVYEDPDTGEQWEDPGQDFGILSAGNWHKRFQAYQGMRMGFRVTALEGGRTITIKGAFAQSQ